MNDKVNSSCANPSTLFVIISPGVMFIQVENVEFRSLGTISLMHQQLEERQGSIHHDAVFL